jgi:hypothetical protein
MQTTPTKTNIRQLQNSLRPGEMKISCWNRSLAHNGRTGNTWWRQMKKGQAPNKENYQRLTQAERNMRNQSHSMMSSKGKQQGGALAQGSRIHCRRL